MNEHKKIKYLTKKVQFNGKDMTLYSVDGCTWSSRKDELVQIIERHESEKLTFGEIRGQLSANKPIAAKKSPEKFNKFRQAALEEKKKAVELVEAEAGKKEQPSSTKVSAKTEKKKQQKPVTKGDKPALPEKKGAKAKTVGKPQVKATPKARVSGKPAKKGSQKKVKNKSKKKAA